ncbi:MAG: tetratricopeptide repeat protein [Prevotella sp.]|nr:tetratricopeptide repeat protein [Prevotella sp.]
MERITELIKHPERLDRDTLYELRSTLALYPYYQTARLLLLQNLFLLHDPTFDEELRRAAIYITDRRVLFDMIEGRHYQLRPAQKPASAPAAEPQGTSRTISLIDNFLGSIPKDDEEPKKAKRKPTPADAAIDYVAYLMESEPEGEPMSGELPQMPGQDLIDSFINSDKGRIILNEGPLLTPQTETEPDTPEEEVGEEYFTETLARIYVKQGRYSKALEIIQRLSLQFPKKNAYFADQIRFLEKLIINNNKKIK